MPDKFLCVIATFDDEASKQMKALDYLLKRADIRGKQTPDIPHHITLAYFDVSQEAEAKQLMSEVCTKTKSFNLNFSHIGLFGLKVLFLAPNINQELLDLRRNFDVDNTEAWTAHATLLIDEPESIHKALDLISKEFQNMTATIQALHLYEFFPTRLIASYELK